MLGCLIWTHWLGPIAIVSGPEALDAAYTASLEDIFCRDFLQFVHCFIQNVCKVFTAEMLLVRLVGTTIPLICIVPCRYKGILWVHSIWPGSLQSVGSCHFRKTHPFYSTELYCNCLVADTGHMALIMRKF